ncbi:MAG: TonB-dependent receptor [Candidatus Krumholzibacteria bacterium]|nr:TonB-dependent receptor [Candidatus Krumholzibacteria bacterium]MDP6669144.1 TonB-dependent receptor [Candidatus Krumholzibacteria bacterium]MDP7021310.1 TonB-dependent receptor [Candidatus Krumholzibacteria bacterium]
MIRGAGGTHFGPNAQGGVINILGRDPQDASELTARGGSRGLFSLDGSRAWQSPAAEWSLEAGQKESEGHLPNGDSRLHHLGARLRSLHGRFHLDAGVAFGEYGVPIMPNRYERFRDWKNTRLSARLQGRLSSRSRWNLSVYGIGESSVLDSYTDASLDTLKSESPFKTLGTGAELSFHRVLGSGTILGTGLQWRRDSADMLFLGGRQAESILGSFLRWTHENPGGMRSEAGLRGDWHSSAEAAFAGHLGFSRRLTPEYSWPELRARGQAYRGSRFPALREFYLTAPAPGWGDPDLLSESSIGWDAGLDLHLSQAIQLRLTRFESNVSNLVERDFSQGMPWRFVNLESVQMNGWEWEGVWKPGKDLQLRVNHETLDASSGPEETPLNLRPETRTISHSGNSLQISGFPFLPCIEAPSYTSIRRAEEDRSLCLAGLETEQQSARLLASLSGCRKPDGSGIRGRWTPPVPSHAGGATEDGDSGVFQKAGLF